MEWKKYTLGQVLCEKGYIRGPFGSSLKRGDLLDEGIPVYEQQHAIYNKRSFRFFINENKYNEMKRFTVYPGDVIISCSGTVGEVSLIREKDPKGIISQALLLLRVDKNIILPKYLLYYLKTATGHNAITSRSSGSVQVNIARREIIENIPLHLPDINNQKHIVSILSSLDDKIENNNRINRNLEAQAQALFKSWFVDFEPWGGVMPEDWREGVLSNIAEYLNGLAMQKYPADDLENSLPVLKIKELGQKHCDENSDRCSKYIKPEYIVNNGDIIFSWSGTLLVDIWCGGICGLNQHLFKVTSNKYPKWFYFLWTKYHLDEFRRIASDKTVTMGHIKRGDLDKAKVYIPEESLLSNMSDTMSPLLDSIVNNSLESQKLAALRDTLLPKLMKGEIAV